MPIKGRSDVARIPRIGKIHLGVKQKSQKSGNEYPTAVDYFVVKSDESTDEKSVEAFRSVYGNRPREITVAFPSNNPGQFFPQFLSSYRRVGERYELYCKGDGETANRVDGQGGRVQMACLYRDCPVFQEGKCKELGQLQFFLPDVPGIGVWQLDTSSWHTTINLNGSIQMVMALTGGRIAMVPLKLRIVPKVVNPDGRPKTVYVLTLGIDDMKLTDFLTRTPLLTAGMPSVEPIPEDELPDDLYLETQLVEDRVSVTPKSTERQNESDTDIAAVSEVKFKPYRDTEAAMVRLASLDGELLELLTAEPTVVKKLKSLREGTAIRFQTTQSQRWVDRLELVDFKVVS